MYRPLHRHARPNYCRTELQGRLGHIGQIWQKAINEAVPEEETLKFATILLGIFHLAIAHSSFAYAQICLSGFESGPTLVSRS